MSTNGINNLLLKNYMTQIKNDNNNTTNTESTSKTLEQEKALQKFAFEFMLQQMMDTSSNPMMGEFLSSALNNEDSFSLDKSMGALSNYNSIIRTTTKYSPTSLKTYSKGSNNSIGGFSGLGKTASKYESNMNPGAISNTPGDYGGKSYGAWQFSSKMGSLDSFVNWLKGTNSELYSKLSQAKAKDGNSFGRNFDAAWTSTALSNKEGFLNVQQDYVKHAFYDKAAQTLKSKFGFDINNRSNALKESLWSTVVQHGVGGTTSVFSKLNLNKSDRDIINDLYNERQKVNIYFRSSSEQVKRSVYNRFTREKQDMLGMLDRSFG